ncbi:hypothetical protein GmHk_06G017638 [Glycine max]|nr:hypothetical protein GmHk_06G017638 [Glycine max]
MVYVRPERFGHVQTIPSPLIPASLLYDEIDEWWMHFGDHLAPAGVSANYMDWFFRISHLFVTPTQQGDEPKQPTAPDVDAYVEPHVPEVPVTAAPDIQWHFNLVVCEGCEAIAERLKRVLNLRMVTVGTKLHDIMEDCMRIAKGKASNGSLRARCRQHID